MKKILIVICASMLVFACANDNDEALKLVDEKSTETPEEPENPEQPEEPAADVSLADAVMPITTANCAISGCHVSGATSPDLTTKEQVIASKASVKSEVESGRMPRGRTLTQTQIDTIVNWVDQGGKDN